MSEKKKCAICGSTKDLVIHHMDGLHGRVLPDATIVLCRRCHARIHGKRDKRFFKWDEVEKRLKNGGMMIEV